ncbi:MAG: hypothetical protein HKN93_01465 [Acidimicrobiia bacterium]|nr:hypothetical protein [Acidimicrobiia bacterium]
MIAALLVLVASSCGGEDAAEHGSEVRSVSENTVQTDNGRPLSVWSPDSGKGWPMVYVLHGLANTRHDMAGFSTALSREGFVVFVPDIRTAANSTAATDVECGYHLAHQRASDFGGDADRPVTVVGWSYGAVSKFFMGLDEAGTGLRSIAEGCPLDTPRPDVFVSIAGCHSTWDGDQEPYDPVASGWANTDASAPTRIGEPFSRTGTGSSPRRPTEPNRSCTTRNPSTGKG